jgi:WD40 repeat protein
METRQQFGELSGHSREVSVMALSPDGETLASGSWDHTIRLWDVSTALNTGMDSGQQIGETLAGHGDTVTGVAFSPDGQTLASGSWDNTIRLWDISTVLDTGVGTVQQIGEPLVARKDALDPVNSLAFSPDGKTLVSGSSVTGAIRVWDVSTMLATGAGGGDLIGALVGHEFNVNCFAFSPDGKTLASGSSDGTVRLWDMESGQQIGEALTGHESGVNSVAFSLDGKTLASGSQDKTIRLWNVETRQQIGEPLRGHTGGVLSVAFSPDGKTLASGSFREIRLWDLEIESWVDIACGRVSRNLTESEWQIYFPGECYRQTCTQYPPEFEDGRPVCQEPE